MDVLKSNRGGFLSIQSEMWMCADSTKTYKVGAGRGSKNVVSISNGRFFVYSTCATKARLIKDVAFRAVKRIASFTHNPRSRSSSQSSRLSLSDLAPTPRMPQRGLGAILPQVPYYYIVLEFLRDKTAAGMLDLSKRERVVLCTDNVEDHKCWCKFIDCYMCSPDQTQSLCDNVRVRRTRGRGAEESGFHSNNDTSDSEDSEVENTIRVAHLDELQKWKHFALELADALSACCDASPNARKQLSSMNADNNFYWEYMEKLLCDIRKGVDSIVLGFDDTQLPLPMTKECNEETLPSNNEWGRMFSDDCRDAAEKTLSAKERKVHTHQVGCDTAGSSVGKESIVPSSVMHGRDIGNKEEWLKLPQITPFSDGDSYPNSVRQHNELNHLDDSAVTLLSSLTTRIEKLQGARQRDGDLSNIVEDNVLAELRSAHRDLGMRFNQLHNCHQVEREKKAMERLTQETCFAYTEAVAVLQQLCYDEYVSLVRSLLSVTRSSLGFVGGSDLRPPHAYMDAMAALDGRLNAVRTKEVDLENVIRDLEKVQKERDEELVALRTNFLRSREAWEGDLEVLAVKLKALQGTSGKNIIILPDSEAAMSAIREIFDCEEGECGENKQELPQVRGDSRHYINKYDCEAGCSYENNEVIRQWATRLACGGGKKCDHIAAYRLERFFRWVLENVVPMYSNTSSICVLEHIIHALSNHMVLLRKIGALTASEEETEEGEETSSMYSKDACRALEELYESNKRIQEILKTHGSEDTAHARNDDKKKFYRLEQNIVQLKKESRILHGIYSEFNANEGNIITCVQEIRNNNEQLRKIKEITGTDAISFIMTNKTNLETTTEAIHKYLATQANRNNNEQGTREANYHDEIENIRTAHKIIKAAAETLIGHEKEKDIQAQETKERLKIIHSYYNQHPNNQSSTAVITENYLVNVTSTRNKQTPTTNEEIQQRKRSLQTLLEKEYGQDKNSTQTEKIANDSSTRAQCLRSIESALTVLGATCGDEPLAVAIRRAAEDARSREDSLQEQLHDATQREKVLEARLRDLSGAVITLKEAISGGDACVSSSDSAPELCDAAVDAVQQLREVVACVSATVTTAMQVADDDTPLLTKCERLSQATHALRASEEHYRTLVGDEEVTPGEAAARIKGATAPGGQAHATSASMTPGAPEVCSTSRALSDDSSTRAQCLRSIESALTVLGATCGDEPLAVAIRRAAEDARSREDSLQEQLHDATQREKVLEARLRDLSGAVITLKEAISGGDACVSSSDSAPELCDVAVDAVQQLREVVACVSATVTTAMQVADDDTPLLTKCERLSQATHALRASEEHYRTLVGDEEVTPGEAAAGIKGATAPGGQAHATSASMTPGAPEVCSTSRALSDDSSTRAQCLRSIESALTVLGATCGDEPLAVAIRRAAEDARSREDSLQEQLHDATQREKVLEARLRDLSGAVITLKEAISGGDACVSSSDSAPELCDVAVDAVQQLREVVACVSATVTTAMQVADDDTPLLTKCERLSQATHALRASEEHYRTLVGDEEVTPGEAAARIKGATAPGGQAHATSASMTPGAPEVCSTSRALSDDSSTRAQCLRSIESALTVLGATCGDEPLAVAIRRAAEDARSREDSLQEQLHDATQREKVLEARLRDLSGAVITLKEAISGGDACVSSSDSAPELCDVAVDAVQQLREVVACVSATVTTAMQVADDDTPLLTKCERLSQATHALRASEEHYRTLVGDEEVTPGEAAAGIKGATAPGGQAHATSASMTPGAPEVCSTSRALSDDSSTRAQCLRSIESALTVLGATCGDEPLAVAIRRAAEDARSREDSLQEQLHDATQREKVLEARLRDLSGAVITLKEAISGGDACVSSSDSAPELCDVAVDAVQQLREVVACVSATVTTAMQVADDDTPLLTKCERLSQATHALRASEEHYRTLVGDEEVTPGEAAARIKGATAPGGQAHATSASMTPGAPEVCSTSRALSDDSSTRAQCLRSIESALTVLGATCGDEPLAVAIRRAAEDARSREDSLQEQLHDATQREKVLEARLRDLSGAVITLKEAISGGDACVSSSDSAPELCDVAVDAVQQLREVVACVSATVTTAMQVADDDTPLLTKCERLSQATHALRASEEHYRTLVGDEEVTPGEAAARIKGATAPGGQAHATSASMTPGAPEVCSTSRALSDDSSTRAQCLRSIESALTVLGATCGDEPLAVAIRRAAEDARSREDSLQEQLHDATQREKVLEARLRDLSGAVFALHGTLYDDVSFCFEGDCVFSNVDKALFALDEVDEAIDSAISREDVLKKSLELSIAREDSLKNRLRKLSSAAVVLHRTLCDDDSSCHNDLSVDAGNLLVEGDSNNGFDCTLKFVQNAAKDVRAREVALEVHLKEILGAVTEILKTVTGNFECYNSIDSAPELCDAAVDAVQQLREVVACVSATVTTAMQVADDDTPLLTKCERLSGEVHALRVASRNFECSYNDAEFRCSLLSLCVEEADVRYSAYREFYYSWFVGSSSIFSTFFLSCCTCSFFDCCVNDAPRVLNGVCSELFELRKLCGNVGHGHVNEGNVTRVDCLNAIKRSVSMLSGVAAVDRSLSLPAQLVDCVQSATAEVERLSDKTENLSNELNKLRQDLDAVVNYCEASLDCLRSVGCCDAAYSPSPRKGAVSLSKLLAVYSEVAKERLLSYRAIIDECLSLVEPVRRRDFANLPISNHEAQRRVDGTSELLLTDRLREAIAELVVLRADRRGSTLCDDEKVMNAELLQVSVRNSVDALVSALDDTGPAPLAVREGGSPPPGRITVVDSVKGDGSSNDRELNTAAAAASIRTQLELYVLAAVRQLREKDRVISAAGGLLQEALLSYSSGGKEINSKDSLLLIASDTVHVLQSTLSQLNSSRESLKQSRQQEEELRSLLEREESFKSVAKDLCVESSGATQSLLNEALERQFAATAEATRRQRALAEFSGSVAALTHFNDKANEHNSGSGIAGMGLALRVDDKWLSDVLKHVSDHVCEFEAAKTRIKLLMADIEDARAKVSASDSIICELESKLKSMEMTHAARIAEARYQVDILNNELQMKTLELERARQSLWREENSVKILKCDAAYAEQSHGNEWKTLSGAHSNLLSDNAEQQWKLVELTRDLRATEKEVQGFLYDCRIASLSDATEKVRSLTTGTAQGILLLDEAERRSKIISEALLGLPCHESLLLRVCSRIATTLSEPCLEQLPSVVEQLKVKLDEYEFLLGVPSRSVGPTRANAILSLKEIANIIEINDAIDDASFLSNLTAAVADFRSKHLLLKKRAKALKEQLNKKTALLEACNAEGEMMTTLLQRANRSSGSEDQEVSNQLLASPPCEQHGHSALSLECRMAAERLTYHNGERMRVLEIFRPFYTGDSVLDACECAKKELEKFCAIESYIRAQLSIMPSGPPAYGQGIRDCFSAPGAGNVTDSASTSELLEEQCSAVVEEMCCLRRIVNASNELIATAGYDVHNGDLPRSIAELLSRNNKDQERLNVLEDEILRTEELRKFVSACATAVGCPIKNVEIEQQTNKVLEAVRGVVSKYNAKQAEVEGFRTPLTASNTTHMEAAKTASTEDPYYDELLRVVEGVEALSIELRVNDSLPVAARSASVELRAREACENLEKTKDVIRSTMQGFQRDITVQKEQLVEQLNELEEVKGFLYNALDIDPSKAQPLSLKQLVGSMRAKLHGVVSENRSIETTLEQLRSENAALEESLRCAEQQLSETRTELRSLCQMDHPQRDGAGQTREGNDVATGLSRRVAKQAEGGAIFWGALSSRPEVKELSDLLVDTRVHSGRIDPATPQSVGVAENCYSRSGSPAFKINNLPIEPHLLLRDLEEVTKERDALLRESERIVDQVQHALCDYVDVQQELFPSSMNTDGMNLGDYEVGVGDIVQRCIERLHVFLSNAHGCREPTTPATRDYASSLEVLTPLNGDGWRHQDNLNAVDAEGPRLKAEFESFSRQLQTLFNDALRMTATDLRLELPPPTEKNNFAALHGLRSLIERLVSRCRDSVASFEDRANSDVNLARRRHSRELQSLLTVFDEHVASLVVDAGNSVLPDRVFEDSASKSGSIGGPPLHLTPQHIAEVGNCLHRIHTDVRHIVITCLRNAEMPLPSALHTATLSSLAKLLGDVVPAMLKQVSALQEAVFSGCQALGSLPLNLSSGTHHLAEWAEHFSTEVQKVIYTKEGCEHLLDSIEVLLTNHGINMTDLYVPAAAQNILGDAVCHSSESCRASPRAYGYIEKVEEHTDLRTGALLSALHNLVEQLERKCRTLTLEWQALTDQNNRLLTAQQENEEELVRVQDHLQEMRQIVKRKVEEDLKLEQSLEGLEDHLDQQARELALKYCADRDIISQQFGELRDTIRRAVMPTQDNVLRGMLHH